MITLKRVRTGPDGTFGVLIFEGRCVCVTAERPWKDNKNHESCVPEGEYNVVPHSSDNYPKAWRLENVPGREGILIHFGNWPLTDSTGCILPGRAFFPPASKAGVMESAATMTMLKAFLPEKFTMKIINCF